MRDFIRPGGTLARLEKGVKLVYSSFLGFALVGILSMALLHTDGMGLSSESARVYWAGDDVAAYPKSYRQLLELTHFHAFSEPVTWLILAHLYHLGGDGLRMRIVVTLAGVLTMATQIALPWAVVYGPGWTAALLGPVHTVFGLCLIYMALAALRDMWLARSS